MMRSVMCIGDSGLVCEHLTFQGDFRVTSGRQDWNEMASRRLTCNVPIGLTGKDH